MAVADVLFGIMAEKVAAEGTKMVRRVGAVFRFIVTIPASGGEPELKKVWLVDLKNGTGSITEGDTESPAEATIELDEANLLLICSGKLTPQAAFMKGKMKVKGNVMKSMKLNPLLKGIKVPSKL
eukprot:TRINITY_DN1412_c0_g1_i1.p2 TRINITY_DN1412_c0_g1~~TRINITY_DN1412_c0_g1_i1.p2  ORF type:complete len:125 (-),score=37.02 TRINITY_DN1412_c0_g1_i1:72-446(-)